MNIFRIPRNILSYANKVIIIIDVAYRFAEYDGAYLKTEVAGARPFGKTGSHSTSGICRRPHNKYQFCMLLFKRKSSFLQSKNAIPIRGVISKKKVINQKLTGGLH